MDTDYYDICQERIKETAEAQTKLFGFALEKTCPACLGTGSDRGRCDFCGGTGYRPTDEGEVIFEFMCRHWRRAMG